MKGKYIVIEGPGGAGKTDTIKYLKAKLPADKFFFVKEPDGPIRSILLDLASQEMNPFTEICLFTAHRCELVTKTIIPKLESGIHVISDRNYLSSEVHQIEASERQNLRSLFKKMTEVACGFCPPDMFILVTAQLEELLRRKSARKGEIDKFDERDTTFQRKVIEAYDACFPKGKPHRIFDTTNNPPPDALGGYKTGEQVLEAVLEFTKVK